MKFKKDAPEGAVVYVRTPEGDAHIGVARGGLMILPDEQVTPALVEILRGMGYEPMGVPASLPDDGSLPDAAE